MNTKSTFIEKIEAEGPGDWTEHEDWEFTWWAKSMRVEERLGAKLVAREIEFERIDQILELPSGQTEKWWEEDESFRSAARASFWGQRERSARPDPSKALKPKQLRAAEVYFVDASSQLETARIVGVSDRTIRNWLRDPVFVLYGEQLRKERADELSREREEQQERTQARYLVQVEKAQDVIDTKLEENDATVALAIARSYMRSVR